LNLDLLAQGDLDPLAAKDLLAGILEASTENSVVAQDLDGRIVLWNAGARRLYGYSIDDVIGQPSSVLHTEGDVAGGLPIEMRVTALKDGKWDGVVERVRKDGSRFPARVVLTPRRDASGTPVGFLLISKDISDELEMTNRLEATRAYADALLESAPDAIVIVSGEGTMELVNAQTERLFGYSREELIGRPVELLVPGPYHDRHPSHRNSFFREPRTRPMGAGLELQGLRRDGTEFPVEISLSPIETERGTVASASIRDVTDRRRVELELRETNAELERANKAKDSFLASMSHELRTPLNAIIGFTGILLMGMPGPLNAEQEKQLETVQTNGKHLLSIINDLLDLTKIGSGRVDIELEELACQDVLEDVAASIRPLAEAKGLTLSVVAPERPLVASSDRRALKQILINLANNAVKFTDSGEVTLAVAASSPKGDGFARFSVSDTGPGIRADQMDRLFEAFEQLEPNVSLRADGTGLGLYISRSLAALIQAELRCESRPGSGSTFTLDLVGGAGR
jgi:PAS domain S-box-containing protein